MKILILSILLSHFNLVYSKVTTIYKTSTQDYISYAQFLNELPRHGHTIMGEYHNDPAIQNAQAQIIKDKVLLEQAQGDFSLMWEFLNYTDQPKIDGLYRDLKNNTIDTKSFLEQTVGKSNNSYASIIDVTAHLNGKVLGINLPRSLKQVVVKGGITALDSKFIPRDHFSGNEDYLERFKLAMGGHIPESKIANYFEAQCLTDSVMAEQIHVNNNQSLNFIVAGSFHTDFYDGTVLRLQNTYQNIVTLKLINSKQTTPEELTEMTKGHEKYGTYADYIVVTK